MLNIAIAGLGTVGTGVMRLLQGNAELIAARADGPITVKAVSSRTRNKKRDCDLSGVEWLDDPQKLAQMPGIDVVVELIGGADGTARGLAEAALKNGKHFVTANKALLAAHGTALARLAEQHKTHLLFEASVCGGIPVIKALREGLAGNRITAVRGILNGTCNYILTRMREAKLDFNEALREAQAKGYAEADPAADIDGHDTANKLAILAALAFGIEPDLAGVTVEGIRRITPLDLQFAGELDCRVKLLGVARMSSKGLEQRVGPCLVPRTTPIGSVDGALNAVSLSADFAGDITLTGQGAGAEPTASAIVSDLVDLARGAGFKGPVFRHSGAGSTKRPAYASPSRYYMRLQVIDKPGVLADISGILRDEAVSMETLLQRGRGTDSVPLVTTTHAADPDAMRRAADKIARVKTVVEPPCLLRIED